MGSRKEKKKVPHPPLGKNIPCSVLLRREVRAYPEQLPALRASSDPTVQAAHNALRTQGSRSDNCDNTLKKGIK